jgi:hypothetical protein
MLIHLAFPIGSFDQLFVQTKKPSNNEGLSLLNENNDERVLVLGECETGQGNARSLERLPS